MEKYIDELVKIKHFFETEIQFTQDKLDRSKENLKNINKMLLDCCHHQWTRDLVDIDTAPPFMATVSKQVTICNLCESTKPSPL